MDKNTIYAIVLSTLVIMGFTFVQAKFFAPPKGSPRYTAATEEEQQHSVTLTGEEGENPSSGGGVASGASQGLEMTDAASGDDSTPEQTYTLETDTVRVTFTNRGGDIVGYELKSHTDRDTGRGVEMADSVTRDNRAMALSFGDSNAPAVNDIFSMKKQGDNAVLFTHTYHSDAGDYVLGKRYTFMPGEYMFKLEVMFHALDGELYNGSYTLRTAPQIGPHYDPKVDRYEIRQFAAFNGDKKKKYNIGAGQTKPHTGYYTWVAIAGKYFTSIIVPVAPATMDGAAFSTVSPTSYANAQCFATRRAVNTPDVTDTYYVYMGPKNERDLRKYNTAESNQFQAAGLRLTEVLQSSGWLGWLESILKVCLEAIYRVIPNWGAAIIILTVLFKLATFPLTKKQSLGTLKMQALQPKIQSLQEKYKGDQQQLQVEMAKLYKENNYNPMAGCAPMILQFLVIFAMYNLFNNYFEFRGASFVPGWIPDLSASDSVYTLKKALPFIGNRISVLPFIYLATQLLYGKITQYGGTAANQSQGQMKFMMYGMPVVFFFVFYNAPSGLLLYWTVSNMIQMVQQVVINNIMAKAKAAQGSANKGQKAVQKVKPPKKRRR